MKAMPTDFRPYYANILVIGANQRKTGKSDLIEAIIGHFNRQKPVALKIAAYDDENVLNNHHLGTSNYLAVKETEASDHKDSKRFLKAGAADSYFIAGMEERLKNNLPELLAKYTDRPVIIESNWFPTQFSPGYLLLLEDKQALKPKQTSQNSKKLLIR